MQKTLLAVLLASMFAGQVLAEDKTITITAQDMPSALHSLASQTGIQLLFSTEELKNIQARELSGSMSAEEALKQLLQGTNYTYRMTGNGTFVLQRIHAASMLDEVTVTATRTEHLVSDVPASVSVLTAKRLKTKHRQNLNDALRDEEGLDFGEQPGVAHQVFPVIRGVGGSFAGATTQVLVDGIPHDSMSSNLMGHGGLNFTPMQDVEKIEVVRGPASALYGPSTVGGVINVIPKRWKGEAGVEMEGSYGTHNTITAGVATGVSKENFDIRVSGYEAKSDGFVAVPVTDAYGQIDNGPRDWKDTKLGLMAGFRPVSGQEITLSVQDYATRSAWLGGRPNDRQNMDGQSVSLGYHAEVGEVTHVKAVYRTTDLKQQTVWDEWDWNGDVGNLAAAYRSGRFTKTTKLLVQADTQISAANQLTVGYGHDTGDYETRSATVGGSTSTQGYKDKVDALFVQDEHKLAVVTLLGGVRYDRLDFSPDTVDGVPRNGSGSVDIVISPRLGARFQVSETSSMYVSYGTAYMPALNTFKFVQPSTTRVDNPDLKPETSVTYEVGMNSKQDGLALRTSLYRTTYKDKITLGTDSATSLRQWQNVAVRKVTGIEIALEGELTGGWKPYANFSYTKAEDQATAGAPYTQSTRVAPRKLNLGITYEPNDAWSATLNGRAVSDMYFNSLTAAQHTGGYFIADAKVSYTLPVSTKWEVFGACNNIGDKKYQPFNIGEWSDGRTVTVGVSGKL
ncbi:MAG: TonB-dependent receptor [Gammaproteobacteria bacterium]|nr:TonB-dependent receptor [Gammaproteobacteria bacterium]MBU1777829.1 TonB-dependent receptor [Gammaproteobacteria bacterium]MBU1969387.1 TonB-dependent receptor [Gammaproteobacteria bacterium]